ncbi:MAG: hypothetical protein HY597_06445 [Candidatus Omnitrophica bacterium]|nr:hypothetical protein [Candidatus Omnitrophota bacterium]
MRRFVKTLALALWLCAAPAVWAEPHVETVEGLTVVFLEGRPYDLGHQHGTLLKPQVQQMVRGTLRFFHGYVKMPVLGPWLVNWKLDRIYRQMRPHIPPAYLDELRGLAEGSGVPLRDLERLHAIPELTTSCSSLAVFGHATADGRLYHTRNLDWNIQAGVQRFAVVFVVRPEGQHALLNIGWAGFIGALSGINDQTISIAQIGAKSTDESYAGTPMPFLLRRILEEASTLGEAVAIVSAAPRTRGNNYVFAQARPNPAIANAPRDVGGQANRRQTVALETTRHHVAVFRPDDAAEHQVSYAAPLPDSVFRADTAMDPTIRNAQLASHGDPNKPGLEDPAGSSAYDLRYLGQEAMIERSFGNLDAELVRAIAQTVASPSNVQSVIYAYPELWVANAEGRTPAANTPYHHLRIDGWLAPTPSSNP